MIINLEGYHGTSLESAQSIQSSKYDLSTGDEEWLGDGVYFFIKGISSKLEDLAVKWAISRAWDNKFKRNKYRNYCVLLSHIEVHDDNFLDLTTEDGLDVFDYIIDRYIKKMGSIRKTVKYQDGQFLNFARRENIVDIEVAKGNFYIKFTKEKIKGLNLRTNNCTICTVFDPAKNIKSTKIITNGSVI